MDARPSLENLTSLCAEAGAVEVNDRCPFATSEEALTALLKSDVVDHPDLALLVRNDMICK